MSDRNRFKRAIVREVITWDERATITAKSFSWSRTRVHTLTAECGHVLVKRGMAARVPKHTICKACEAGKAAEPIDPSMHGRFDKTTPDSAMTRVATAILANAADEAKRRTT